MYIFFCMRRMHATVTIDLFRASLISTLNPSKAGSIYIYLFIFISEVFLYRFKSSFFGTARNSLFRTRIELQPTNQIHMLTSVGGPRRGRSIIISYISVYTCFYKDRHTGRKFSLYRVERDDNIQHTYVFSSSVID
jgi:hypothetical protein